jgi:hypothetical protein
MLSTEKTQISVIGSNVAYVTSVDAPCASTDLSLDAKEYAIAYVPGCKMLDVPIVIGDLNWASFISQKSSSFAGIMPSSHWTNAQSYHGQLFSYDGSALNILLNLLY